MTILLSSFSSSELIFPCRAVHCFAIVSGLASKIPVGNALITGYFNCGEFFCARKVFDGMPDRNVITWTAMISGLVHRECFLESLLIFREMKRNAELKDCPNSMTYSISVSACSGLRGIVEGSQLHALVVKDGYEGDVCVQSSIMDLYSKCGFLEGACKVFDSADVVDEISFTVILVGFTQNGMEEQAIALFVKILRSGEVQLDPNMISAVLGAFGDSGQLSLGKQIHSLALKSSFCKNVFVGNGLVNMYSKCGELDSSLKLFDEMPERNVVSWNALISALARHGRGEDALRVYDAMAVSQVIPNDVTFLSLLHSCGHVGNVQMGLELLRVMGEAYQIRPRAEHWACVVDMMGRAGLVDEARGLINRLGDNPGPALWQALLGTCAIQGDLETGEYAAEQLVAVAPACSAAYVQLANIYSVEERWKERAKMVKKMRDVGARKEPALSWIEVGKNVHVFVVGDRDHPLHGSIYHMLEILTSSIYEEG